MNIQWPGPMTAEQESELKQYVQSIPADEPVEFYFNFEGFPERIPGPGWAHPEQRQPERWAAERAEWERNSPDLTGYISTVGGLMPSDFCDFEDEWEAIAVFPLKGWTWWKTTRTSRSTGEKREFYTLNQGELYVPRDVCPESLIPQG